MLKNLVSLGGEREIYIEAWAIWLIPLIGSFIAYGIAKRKKLYAGYFSLGISIMCFFLSLKILYDTITSPLSLPYQDTVNLFYGFGVSYLEFGILIDEFNILIIFFLAFISIVIFIYSLEYMREEIDLGRYWFWKNFSLGSMFLLVLSNNFIEMLIAFLMLSLCSWGLISFWYKKPDPSVVPDFDTEGKYNKHCGTKALITIFIAGCFMEVAIILLEFATMKCFGHPTLNFLTLSKDNCWVTKLLNTGILPLFSILIISSSLAISAQFPFHDWFPESTAGPITASALINSATTINVGVYILGRLFLINYDLYSLSAASGLSLIFEIAIVCGLITIILTGAYGIVAKDLKRILAFSTSNQLGYIFFIFGIAGLYLNYSAFIAGVLYMLTHSIFKSLLFLSSGSIIHSTGIKNVYEMGSLRKYMKKTYVLMMIGAFSIVGIPPLAGYLSIQLIVNEIFIVPAWITILFIGTFLLTNLYIFRMIGLIFFGTESEKIKKIKVMEKIHKPTSIMTVPLIILATLSFGLIFFYPTIINFISRSILLDISFDKLFYFLSNTFLSIGTYIIVALLIIGLLISYPLYFTRKISTHTITSKYLIKDIHKLLKKRVIFNPLYYSFYKGIFKLGNATKNFHLSLDKLYHGVGQRITKLGNATKNFHQSIDKFYRRLAYGVKKSGNNIRKFHTGKINLNLLYYVISIFLSLIIIYALVRLT